MYLPPLAALALLIQGLSSDGLAQITQAAKPVELTQADWVERSHKQSELVTSPASTYSQALDLVAIAQGYADLGQSEQALALVNDAIDLSKTLDAESPRNDLSWRIAGVLATAGQIPQAIQLSSTISDPLLQERASVQTALALIKNGRVSEALQLTSAITTSPDEIDLTLGLAEAGFTAEAVQFATTSQPERIKFMLASKLAKAGFESEAIQVADSVDDVSGRMFYLSKIASSLTDVERVDQLLQVLDTVKANSSKNQAPVENTLVNIAVSFAQKGWFAAAEKAVFSIDTAVFKSMAIEKLAALPATSENTRILEQTALSLNDDTFSPPTLPALEVLIQKLAQASQFAEARQVAIRLQQNDQQAVALATIARYMAQSGDADGASQTFAEALQLITPPDDLSFVIGNEEFRLPPLGFTPSALAGIANQLAQAGRTEQSNQLFGEALKLANSDSSPFIGLSYVAGYLGAAGQTELAKQTLSAAIDIALADKTYRNDMLVSLGYTVLSTEQPLLALAVLPLVPDDFSQKQGLLEDIAKKLIEQGNATKALEIVSSSAPTQGQTWTLEAVAQHLSEYGYFSEARTLIRLLPQDDQRVYIANVFREQYESGQVMEALAWLASEVKSNAISDDLIWISPFLTQPEHFQLALRIAQKISSGDDGERLIAPIEPIFQQMARTQSVAEILQLSKILEDDGTRNSAIRASALELAQKGQASSAKELILTLPKPWQAWTLASAASLLAKAEQPGPAAEFLEQASALSTPTGNP